MFHKGTFIYYIFTLIFGLVVGAIIIIGFWAYFDSRSSIMTREAYSFFYKSIDSIIKGNELPDYCISSRADDELKKYRHELTHKCRFMIYDLGGPFCDGVVFFDNGSMFEVIIKKTKKGYELFDFRKEEFENIDIWIKGHSGRALP